jgi:DNA-binding NtrC family response regulator
VNEGDNNSHTTMTLALDARGLVRALNIPRLTLTVLQGSAARRTSHFHSQRVVLGSGKGVDLRLDAPTVSALHAELSFDPAGLRVRDLGAKNGVMLRGRRVLEAWLQPGDVLALGECEVRVEVGEPAEQPLSNRTRFGRLEGSSLAMRVLYQQLERIAASDATVLITGETGTGKELAAEALIMAGPRAEGPFVVVDCHRSTTDLFESELFGHVAGAYTGAVADVPGAFERAHGGTLVLDEVGSLPLSLQATLLGVLERRRLKRIGAVQERAVDVRIIATTQLDLEREVNRGNFRSDLFFRLSALSVRMPNLRERADDLPLLVSRILEDLGARVPLSPVTLERLCSAHYPGNVRELRSAVERALLGLLPSAPPPAPGSGPVTTTLDVGAPLRPQRDALVESIERDYLTRLLEAHRGNASAAIRASGLSRVHFYELLRRHGLEDALRVLREDGKARGKSPSTGG